MFRMISRCSAGYLYPLWQKNLLLIGHPTNITALYFQKIRTITGYRKVNLQKKGLSPLSIRASWSDNLISIPQMSARNFASTKRKRYRTEINKTISRTNGQHRHISLTDDLKQAQDLIEDHAYRRAQLFYYLLLLYYREGCEIKIAGTRHQHGRSKCPHCSAAHSSIIPNIEDSKTLFSRESHFYHNLNSTVEVPKIVNEFDSLIENHFRSRAISILNLVSLRGLHPFRGLDMFIREITLFFDQSAAEIERKISLLKALGKTENKIRELEIVTRKEGYIHLENYLREVFSAHKIRKELQLLKKYSGITKLDRYPAERNALFNTIIKRTSECVKGDIILRLRKIPPLNPEKTAAKTDKLRALSLTLQIERQGTRLPPQELLSGKFTGSCRRLLSEEELLEQKRELLLP